LKLVYLSYPYTDDPKKRAEEVKALTRALHRKRPDLVILIPHFIFDAIWDFQEGYSIEAFLYQELELISRCDLFCIIRGASSAGVMWEEAFAKWLKDVFPDSHPKIVTWRQLMEGNE